jgi:hypothetical protein
MPSLSSMLALISLVSGMGFSVGLNLFKTFK